MQVQQQAYLQHALNAFDAGAVQHALAYIAQIAAPIAPNVWVQLAARLSSAPVAEAYRHAWCARLFDVPDAQRACAAAQFLHALWRVTLMQVQGRAIACPRCRVLLDERALEPRCDACRRIAAACAVCDTCHYVHGGVCYACDDAHPLAIPCADIARASRLGMGAGLYMPQYIRAAFCAPRPAERAFVRRPRADARADAPRRAAAPLRGSGPSRVSLILTDIRAPVPDPAPAAGTARGPGR